MNDKTVIVGKKGAAEIIKIFAATTNSDLSEGRGKIVDHSHYETARGARLGSVGIGVQGTDGSISPRFAIRFEDGEIYLLQPQPFVVLGDEQKLEEDVRKVALSKLTPAERQALNLE